MANSELQEVICPRCKGAFKSYLNPGYIAKCPNLNCKAILAPKFSSKRGYEGIIDTDDSYDDHGISLKNVDWYTIDIRKIDWSKKEVLDEIFSDSAYKIQKTQNPNFTFSQSNSNALGTYAIMVLSIHFLYILTFIIFSALENIFSDYLIESIPYKIVNICIFIFSMAIPVMMVSDINQSRVKITVYMLALVLFINHLLSQFGIFNIYQIFSSY